MCTIFNLYQKKSIKSKRICDPRIQDAQNLIFALHVIIYQCIFIRADTTSSCVYNYYAIR